MTPATGGTRHVREPAATSPEEHDNALAYDFPMFSLPMESAEVKAAL